MSKIWLKNIYKNFDNKRVLEDINLSVEEGSMISLLGPSGCGKSTTLKIIAGILTPDKGDILFNGNSVLKVPIEKRGAVIVFQNHLLFPHLSVEDNIGFGLRMAKVDKAERMKKVKDLIELVELQGHEKKYPDELSGGQSQRVSIARALAIEPKVLLLDEPFSSLDINLRQSMREFICNIQRRLGITTILVTHDKDDALMTSDEIAVMINGSIRQVGTPIEIYERPNSPEVANFFGERNYIKGMINDHIFSCVFGKYEVEPVRSISVKAMVKPEDVHILPSDQASAIKGVIKTRTYVGDRVFYTIICSNEELRCTASSERLYEPLEEVAVNIDFKKAMFYGV